ncbi:hypothetical protein F4808DRAFT_435259 [Astrocystis sublimbata]|nr:hypothetical protein F4808DRAFT_435259 [Astrocystis sublimbata]
MFGAFAGLVQPPSPGPPPKNVPPPTPVNLPQCNPQFTGSSDSREHPSLVRYLQKLYRPTQLNESYFAAVGVHVHVDAPAEQVIPEPWCLPSASGWDGIDIDEARRRDPDFRKPLSNGRLSPEARVYTERREELSTANQAAFRTVCRFKPEPGKPPVRLGHCYEFFRRLEFMATYWDDTSLPPLQDEDTDQESHATSTPQRTTYRKHPTLLMPPELRHNMVSAFVKLVSYDFGCNLSPPKVEPRLYLREPDPSPHSAPVLRGKYMPRKSHFPSGCGFLCRTPTTREAARAGIVEGPIAAISVRHATGFTKPLEAHIDFGRELVAALATAQIRAREADNSLACEHLSWWCNKKRWGGGEGGPIGRELEGDLVAGDKDAQNAANSSEDCDLPNGIPSSAERLSGGPLPGHRSSSSSITYPPGIPVRGFPLNRGAPLNKRPRKTLTVYDRYRMIKPPSSNYDPKTRYMQIGKVPNGKFDDVFVVSSLYHHICLMRVRVPDQLLKVLSGHEEPAAGGRSWEKLEIWRSQWFDMFIPEQRLEAMRLLWGMMAWTMRETNVNPNTKSNSSENWSEGSSAEE